MYLHNIGQLAGLLRNSHSKLCLYAKEGLSPSPILHCVNLIFLTTHQLLFPLFACSPTVFLTTNAYYPEVKTGAICAYACSSGPTSTLTLYCVEIKKLLAVDRPFSSMAFPCCCSSSPKNHPGYPVENTSRKLPFVFC